MDSVSVTDKISHLKKRSILTTENRLLTSSLKSFADISADSRETQYSIPEKFQKVSITENGTNFNDLMQQINYASTNYDDMSLEIPSDSEAYSCSYSIDENASITRLNKAKLKFICCLMSSVNSESKMRSGMRPLLPWLALEYIESKDPEFILKSAVYCRKVLNVRFTTNFLLAYAAKSSKCRPYLSKYFSAAIGLPSDLMKVAEVYMSLNKSNAMRFPNALRSAIVEKFIEFDQYQLAKYNKPTVVKSGKETLKLSLKQLIRNLHISEPVENVMSLLGKTYPLTASDFLESGLPGQWDPGMAGYRMRLPVPYTWETELSSTPKAQHVSAWHELIDSGRLPYMAMLRNLRNLLIADIDDAHVTKVVHKLTNEKSVVNSKQFPTAFMTAYQRLASIEEETVPKVAFSKIRGRPKFRPKPREIKFNPAKRAKLMQALELAFDLSIRLNLPTISGSTLIFVSTAPGNNLKTVGNSAFSKSFLLAFMCMMACEDYDAYFLKGEGTDYCIAKLCRALMPGKNRILESVTKISANFDENNLNPLGSYSTSQDGIVVDILTRKKKYTSMVVIGQGGVFYELIRNLYISQVGPINSVAVGKARYFGEWILVPDESESVIQLLARLGNGSLVQQVETIDRQFDLSLNPSKGAFATGVVAKGVPASQINQISGGSGLTAVQVFVSSTFQDMYGERDLICGLIFPALRKNLSRLDHPVLLNEIDLRWGVPEAFSQSGECLRMCLEKVVTSDYLVLLVGERYGWSPSEEVLGSLPPKLLSHVMKIYKKGMSVTEMEARLFLEIRSQNRKNVLCFLRNPSSLNNVPRELRDSFLQTAVRERERLLEFKNFLKENGLVQLNDYPASFTGVIGSKPMMGNLTVLGETIFNTLYSKISEHVRSKPAVAISLGDDSEKSGIPTRYLEAVAASVAPRQLREVLHALLVELPILGARVKQSRMEGFQSHKRPHTSSKKIYPPDGGVLCVVGSYGSGKTTLVSALAMVLSTPGWMPVLESQLAKRLIVTSRVADGDFKVPESYQKDLRVFVHLTLGAYSSSTLNSNLAVCAIPQMTQLQQLLQAWICRIITEFRQLSCDDRSVVDSKLDELERDCCWGCDIAKSIEVFHKLLEMIGCFTGNNYVFIVDSVDHLVPSNLSWVPTVIPHNVRFVFTLNGGSRTMRTLSIRRDCLILTMRELSRDEKTAAVRCYFAQYGKVLSDSGFGNQLSRVTGKRDSNIPMYLKMVCDELRLYSTYDTLDSDLKSLPDRLPDLVMHIVARASSNCGESLVRSALACILCSRHAPFPAQLQRMLNLWLYATCGNADKRTLAFFNGDEDEIPQKDDSIEHPVLSNMALNVLLAQLQPLLVGVESVDESICGLKVSERIDQTEMEESEKMDLNFFAANGLRLCSLEVANVIRCLCFTSMRSASRFSASKRLGYVKSSAPGSAPDGADFETPTLESTPTETQTYLLLLCENFDNYRDKVYYAFRAKKLKIALSALSSISYVQQKAMNNDIDGLIGEYVGFGMLDPEVKSAWTKMVEKEKKSMFKILKDFVFKSGHTLLRKYPQLTGQLLLTNLPGYCEDSTKTELERIVRAKTRMAVSPYNVLSSNCLRGMELVSRPETLTSATCVASDGQRVLACGDGGGSITLLDTSSGKVLNTLYGHGSCVNAIVFITPEARNVVMRCTLLYSVSADSTACLWKLVPSGDDGSGLLGVRLACISDQHSRAITACAWDSQCMHLFTAGLDGFVHLFAIQPSLSGDADGDGNFASGLDLESFRKSQCVFSTDKQPINAMVLVKEKVVVGCWNGTLWVFGVNTCPQVVTVILIGSVNDSRVSGTRDAEYCSEWAGVCGRHAAIVALAYSGPEWDILACADYSGEVTLINANSFESIVKLESRCLIPRHISSRLCFVKLGDSGDCLLAHTGSSTSTVGSIALWNVSHAQKIETLLERKPISPSICIAKLLEGNIAIVGDDWGSVGCKNLSSEKNFLSLFTSTDKIRVQALDCAFIMPVSNFLIVAWGGFRGNVTFLAASVNSTQSKDWELNKLIGKPFHLSPHSSGQLMSAAGGTLALSISSKGGFAVSGGGDTVCCFYRFDRSKMATHGCDSDTVVEVARTAVHTAGVSALVSHAEFAVSGGKDGLLVLYEFCRESLHQPVRVLDSFPQAHHDWITCLAMREQSPGHWIIISGGNDHGMGVWHFNSSTGFGSPTLSRIWFAQEHSYPLIALSFKEQLLLTASADGSVVTWRVSESDVRKVRKFILPEVSSGGRLVMIDIDCSDFNQRSHDDKSDTEGMDLDLGLNSLFDETAITISDDELEVRREGKITVGFTLSDGFFKLNSIFTFKPAMEVACAGHTNVLDGSTIHLATGCVNGNGSTLISAATVNDQLGEVCIWKLDANDQVLGKVIRQNAGAVTAIEASGQHIFVGCDDGQVSAWCIRDGRRVQLDGLLPKGTISDLVVGMGRSGEMRGQVIVNGFAKALEINGTEGSKFSLDFYPSNELSQSTSGPFAYSVLYDQDTEKFVFGTSDDDLHVGNDDETNGGIQRSSPTSSISSSANHAGYRDCLPRAVTCVNKFNRSGETCFVGLDIGRLCLFDSSGREKQERYLHFSIRTCIRDLQIISHSNKSYLLFSGTEEFGRDNWALYLHNNDFKCLAKYELPLGRKITAFKAIEVDQQRIGSNGRLILVAGSDGILRYLQCGMDESSGILKLIGCLPMGRMITKICAMATNRFALGFSNGDLGMYQFI